MNIVKRSLRQQKPYVPIPHLIIHAAASADNDDMQRVITMSPDVIPPLKTCTRNRVYACVYKRPIRHAPLDVPY